MSTTLFSDFPDGGASASNPISPVRECPIYYPPSKIPSRSLYDLETALRSSAHSRRFSERIAAAFSKLPVDTASLKPHQISIVLKLASLCRSRKEVLAVLGYERKKLSTVPLRKSEGSVTFPVLKTKGFHKQSENIARVKPVPRTAEERREHIRAWTKAYRYKKRATDNGYRILCCLRARLSIALKGHKKTNRTQQLLGCSLNRLKEHLESQWQPGMSWENYGTHGWHIDHIVPCCAYDMKDPDEQEACFHYTNLQPLWAKENLIKSGKFDKTRIKWKISHDIRAALFAEHE